MKLRFNSDLILVWRTGWLLLESKWHIAYRTHFCATHRRALSRLRFQWAQGRKHHIFIPKASDTWTLVNAPTFHWWHLRCGWRVLLCFGSAQRAAVYAAGWPRSLLLEHPAVPSATIPEPHPNEVRASLPRESTSSSIVVLTDKWTGQGRWQLLRCWRSVELKHPGVLGNYRTNQPT